MGATDKNGTAMVVAVGVILLFLVINPLARVTPPASSSPGLCQYAIFDSGSSVVAATCGSGKVVDTATDGHADEALQKVLTLMPNGGTIDFDPGGYTFYSQTVITEQSVYIVGAGQGYNLLSGPGVTFYPGTSGMGYILDFWGVDNGGVANILMRAGGMNTAGGVWIHDSSHVNVNNDEFWGDGWKTSIAITGDATNPPSGDCCAIWNYVTYSSIDEVDAGDVGLSISGVDGHNAGSNSITSLNIAGNNNGGTGVQLTGEAVSNFFYALDAENLAVGVSDNAFGTLVSGIHTENNLVAYQFGPLSQGGVIDGGEMSEGVSGITWSGEADRVTGVAGVNPVGVIPNPIGTAYDANGARSIGLGGTSPIIADDTNYKVVGVDLTITCTGGTGTSLLVSDNQNNVVANGLATPFTFYLPVGYTFNLTYATAPACIVSGD